MSSVARALLLLQVLVAFPACVGQVRPGPRVGAEVSARFQGVWDLVSERREPEGDLRIERVEWHLQSQAGGLRGFVHRSLTWRSGDGAPFRCSGQLEATRSWRTVVEGAIQAGGSGEVTLVASDGDPTACGDAGRDPEMGQRCTLVLLPGAHLGADCGRGAIVLARRLEAPIPLQLAIHRPDSATGVWTWHHRSHDTEGDTKVESEVWRLEQFGSALRGSYLRIVVVRSGDGRRFQCNGALQYTNESRFEIAGSVQGRRIKIRELSFRARPHRCETGARTLDAYEGLMAEDGRLIRLSWGRGAQLLYRRF